MVEPADDTRLQAALADWQHWPVTAKPRFLTTFTTGLNHQTCLIETGGTKLVLKLFANGQQAAINSHRWAAELGTAPAVHYSDAQAGYAVFAYIDAAPLEPGNLSPPTLAGLAVALKTIHNASYEKGNGIVDVGDFDLLQYCELYLGSVTDEHRQLATIHRQLLPALEIFINDPTPWCLCHNDLVAENCFLVNGRAQFIDWEYAQRHNPWFDLAAIILYLDLDPEQAQCLLAAYQTRWQQRATTPIYYAAQCALLWVDMLWHLSRGEASWTSLAGKWRTLQGLAAPLNINLEGHAPC